MDDTLATIKTIFDNVSFHHLLVIDNDNLRGIISDRDLLKALSPTLGTAAETSKDLASLNKKAHQIMTRKPITTLDTATLYQAISVFNRYTVSCLPVVNKEGKVVGILSWRDIFKKLEESYEKKS